MNEQKTINAIPVMLFEDECFPDISIDKTDEENSFAIQESFKKIREQIDRKMEKVTVE